MLLSVLGGVKRRSLEPGMQHELIREHVEGKTGDVGFARLADAVESVCVSSEESKEEVKERGDSNETQRNCE